jgi:hydroxyacylglutathione hydrolase
MLEIIPIPALKDNYIWLGVNRELGQVFAVDPGDAAPVLEFLEANNLALAAILVTHKHVDHTGGIADLLAVYPNVPVYAHPVEKVPTATHLVEDGATVELAMWPDGFKVIHIPGHTLGHVAYYAKDVVFSGDTLFGAGCGRVFEGTAEQMLASLKALSTLPDSTRVYCGHEYTLANLRFAAHVEPKNSDIQQRTVDTAKMRDADQPSLPSLMSLELKTNPFLRCDQVNVIAGVEAHVDRSLATTVDVFRELREWKNNF